MNKNGKTLPDIPTPKGEIEVTGTVEIPRKPPVLSLHTFDDDRNWGVRWPFLDTDYYAAQNKVLIQSFYILQDPNDKHSFVREWPAFNAKQFIHFLIAFQWFVFAVIAVAVFLGMSLTRKEEQTENYL